MSSPTISLTDAVIADLNAATFSQAFTAVRVDQAVSDVQSLATLHVSVMPAKRTVIVGTRGGKVTYRYRIDIAVQFKFQPAAAADFAPYLQLAEEMVAFYGVNRPSPAAQPQATFNPQFPPEHLFLFVPDHWEKRLFTSVLAYHFDMAS